MSGIAEGVPPSKQSRVTKMAAAKQEEQPQAPLDIWQDCLRKFDEDSAAPAGGDTGTQGASNANEPYTLLVLGTSHRAYLTPPQRLQPAHPLLTSLDVGRGHRRG